MGDTIIISNQDSLQNQLDSFPPQLRDSIISVLDQNDTATTKPSDSHVYDILFFCFLAVFVYFKVRGNKSSNDELQSYISTEEPPANDPEFYYYNGRDINLSDEDIIPILQKYFAYYTNLSSELQEIFLSRLKKFMSLKTFRLPRDETFKEIPVLLSASAVELTFGLDDFTFPWFQNIDVNAAEYLANDPTSLRILAGNVENQTITIAWTHFLSGINNNEDGSNVGLHELAHALYYEHAVAENDKQKTFANALEIVMQEIQKIFNAGKNEQSLFSDYAFRNTQEFWAESVEIFFERTADMQNQFPDLFNSIKELLQQNPLNKEKPLTS
jgi:Mlc titration factor MtfA (ptsG expression regulator)